MEREGDEWVKGIVGQYKTEIDGLRRTFMEEYTMSYGGDLILGCIKLLLFCFFFF